MTNTWKPIDEQAKEYDRVLLELVSTDPNTPALCWGTWDICAENWRMTYLAGCSVIPVKETGKCKPIRYMVIEGYEQSNSKTEVVNKLRAYEQAQKDAPTD